MAAAVKEGDHVSTPDGPGRIVSIWIETSWAFGVPRQFARLTVELDEGGGQWRRVYNPADLRVEARDVPR